jgi:hypothetical protein
MSIDNVIESQDEPHQEAKGGRLQRLLRKAQYAVMVPVIALTALACSENKTIYDGHGRDYKVDPALTHMTVKTGKFLRTGEVYEARINPPSTSLQQLDPNNIFLESYTVKPVGPFNNETYDDPSGNKVDKYVLKGKQEQLRRMVAEDASAGRFKRWLLYKGKK